MLKEFINTYGHRLCISIDMGILVMGIFMTFIGIYPPICGNVQNDMRASIGAVCMAIWFILFPAINGEKKDKIVLAMVIHVVIILVVTFICFFEVKYFLENMNQGEWYCDILFCVGGVFILSYLLYVLLGFIKTFFQLVEKVKDFVFPKLKEEVSGVINVIEAITAGLLSITAFGGSIVGIVTFLKQVI